MGGFGSGRYRQKKTTREESLVLGISTFREHIFFQSAGTATWTRQGTVTNSIGFFITWGSEPTLTLLYQHRAETVEIPIRLTATFPLLGGRRWWFTCPLIVNGRACNRRVGKLYLPPGAQFFGCRCCHRLTYRSCQEAHKMERMMAWADSCLGMGGELARLFSSRRRSPSTR